MQTYKIIRHRRNFLKPMHNADAWGDWFNQRTIKRGLSLDEAQAHCRREDTHGANWFDAYTSE